MRLTLTIAIYYTIKDHKLINTNYLSIKSRKNKDKYVNYISVMIRLHNLKTNTSVRPEVRDTMIDAC